MLNERPSEGNRRAIGNRMYRHSCNSLTAKRKDASTLLKRGCCSALKANTSPEKTPIQGPPNRHMIPGHGLDNDTLVV
jgi:hypothetical protein